jgi:tellurite resistance protein TerC
VESVGTPFLWSVFLAAFASVLALDLVFFRGARTVPMPKAAAWTAFCVSLALAFDGWIWWSFGSRPGLEFLTGYLVEYALSVDNLFVFLVIFSFFSVPPQYQRRALFWGILGAIVLRGAFIVAGTALIHRFHWMIYVFGAFLVWTGVKLLYAGDESFEVETNPAVRLARRFLPVTGRYHAEKFFVRIDGRWMATPLFLVLVVIDIVDVVFAVDSIPAVFGVTKDPFLVFTSNMFAILGLRALYFLLADFMNRFHYLKYGLGLVLAFVGAKMIAAAWVDIPVGISLGVIVLLLGGSVAASFLFPPAPRSAPAEVEPERGREPEPVDGENGERVLTHPSEQ